MRLGKVEMEVVEGGGDEVAEVEGGSCRLPRRSDGIGWLWM